MRTYRPLMAVLGLVGVALSGTVGLAVAASEGRDLPPALVGIVASALAALTAVATIQATNGRDNSGGKHV